MSDIIGINKASAPGLNDRRVVIPRGTGDVGDLTAIDADYMSNIKRRCSRR